MSQSSKAPDRSLGPSPKRLAIAITALTLLTLLGTLGYIWLEGLGLVDALFMTVITLSTVGYREVQPLSDAGRLYTLGLIVLGIGTAFYTVGAFAQFMLEGRLRDIVERRAMNRTIDSLRNHVIVCGCGRLGRAVADRLSQGKTPFVVIENDPETQAACEAHGHLLVRGSALEDASLVNAGIERARALVAATGSDSDNVFIALGAREAAPEIRIHARAETAAGIRGLRLAGACQVISPHQLGGQRIANAIERPAVVEFLELSTPGSGAKIDLEEVVLDETSRVANLALRDLAERGISVSVVAIKRGEGPIQLRPSPEDVLRPGDRVIVVGDRPNLVRMAERTGDA
jgi:voltage-gated potassium channel